ncbi:MAG: alanyl-tRNA editing protein [Candidatus Promineifilaceae bacterium]|nr:alanyl-tRNA editing protein [Candidatus Promineifilaceae bacterium]
MNNRQYYHDSYTTIFDAEVVELSIYQNRPAVVLDQTYFYPTSGGQPHDLGQLNHVRVSDVTIRSVDGAILHVLEGKLEAERVSAAIDWTRRFDHMQHHTGQHILSQAFIRIADAQTIGFHLSDSSVTIDLDKEELSAAEIEAAEELSNEIIWQNLAVEILEVTPEETRSLPLRKIPPVDHGLVRLINITDFDLTACGGTHVANTAEVGVLKIIKQERRSGKLRIEFVCGQRALTDYRQRHEVTSLLSSQLTTGLNQLSPAVARLQDELKEARREVKNQQGMLDHIETQQLLNQGGRYSDFTLVTEVFSDRDPGQIRALGNKLARNHGAVALLGLAGERSQLTFCKAASVPGNMKELLYVGLNELGSNSGGGNETFAQGVGPAATADEVCQAINTAKKIFLRNLGAHEIE